MLDSVAFVEMNFSFRYRRAQSPRMRGFVAIVTITFAASAAFAADVRDLGVPSGWRASDYDNHGYDLLNKGNYENARRYFDAAIRTDPAMWTAYYNRAMAFCLEKKWAAALQDLNSTIRLKPSFFTATLARAAVNSRLGNYRAKLSDLNSLAELTAKTHDTIQQAEVLNSRAWLRATCPDASMRNGTLAVADARRACDLDVWELASHIDTLAAAYAEAGDFASAIRYQEEAISKAKALPQKASKMLDKLRYDQGLHKRVSDKLAGDVQKSLGEFGEHLELYKQHRPYRDIR
jgi:tetratricopeptide (TPR) repeat protein